MFEFFSQNALYIVMSIVLIGWVGIFWYLLRLDKKMNKIEKMFKE
ncbi:MAG: CcmD family protein [Chlorobiaceae bacterium]|nr:CcmD family protein [Chlorobiaceae bacterium]